MTKAKNKFQEFVQHTRSAEVRRNMSKKKCRGMFPGAPYVKSRKKWTLAVRYKKHMNYLGGYTDPVTVQILRDFVVDELYYGELHG